MSSTQHLEHDGFGITIVLPTAVIIKVFVHDVCHNRHIDVNAVQPALLKTVAGHLQYAVRHASFDHFSEISLYARRARRGDVQAGSRGLVAVVS